MHQICFFPVLLLYTILLSKSLQLIEESSFLLKTEPNILAMSFSLRLGVRNVSL